MINFLKKKLISRLPAEYDVKCNTFNVFLDKLFRTFCDNIGYTRTYVHRLVLKKKLNPVQKTPLSLI